MYICVSDPFVSHFEIDLDDKVAEELSGCKTCQKEEVKVCYRLMSFFLDTVNPLYNGSVCPLWIVTLK